MECGKAAFPSLAKAELSKLRFKQMLEHRRDVGAQGFNGPLSVVCMVIVEEGIVPSFAKEGTSLALSLVRNLDSSARCGW